MRAHRYTIIQPNRASPGILAAVVLLLSALACALPLPASLQPSTPTFTPSPTRTPTPTATATLMPTITPIDTGRLAPWPLLQRGASDFHEIIALQRILRQHGFVVYVTGRFGDQTLAAVKAAQAALGIPAGGVVDEDTWVALVHDLQVREGESSEAAAGAKYLLREKFGYDVGMGTSDFGSEAARALVDFQARFRLPSTAVVDVLTWQALISIRPAAEPRMSNPP